MLLTCVLICMAASSDVQQKRPICLEPRVLLLGSVAKVSSHRGEWTHISCSTGALSSALTHMGRAPAGCLLHSSTSCLTLHFSCGVLCFHLHCMLGLQAHWIEKKGTQHTGPRNKQI